MFALKTKTLIFRVLLALVVAQFVVACGGGGEDYSGGSSGCGTQMGCCPATGCTPPNSWYGSSTALCYNTANNCTNAGNSNCRQCY